MGLHKSTASKNRVARDRAARGSADVGAAGGRSRKVALVGIGCAVGVLAAALLLRLPLDGDDDAVTLDTFTGTVAPKKETSTVLLAPVGKDWWMFLDGVTNQSLSLDGFAYPDNAQWIGYSAGRAQKALDRTSDNMVAAYIGFDTHADARQYWEKARHNKPGTPVTYSANIVLISQASVDVVDETFPKKFPTFDGHVSKAIWRYNLTEDVTQILGHSPYYVAGGDFFGALGISPQRKSPTVWEASSGSPTAWWKGTLTGYAKKKVSLSEATFHFPSTQNRDCNKDLSQCTILGEGLGDLFASGTLSAGGTVFGTLTDHNGDPQKVDIGSKESDILSGSYPPQTWRALFLGGQSNQNPVLTRMDFRITSKTSMMMRPVLDEKLLPRYK